MHGIFEAFFFFQGDVLFCIVLYCTVVAFCRRGGSGSRIQVSRCPGVSEFPCFPLFFCGVLHGSTVCTASSACFLSGLGCPLASGVSGSGWVASGLDPVWVEESVLWFFFFWASVCLSLTFVELEQNRQVYFCLLGLCIL
jgi:hypothetical protein